MYRINRHGLKSDLLTGVLLAALVLRAVTPSGYMPGNGPLGLTLCVTSGLPVVALQSLTDTTPAPDSEDTGRMMDANCAFATAPTAAPAPSVLVLRLAVDTASAAPVANPGQAHSLPTIQREQSPRGPPASA